ncbi:MAG TPA: 3,4-dihydroxy-2-butanone-4-phosphate synthase, partial [Candidatus Nesterenkonia stercoripullorum]|nr:3,4-dihydroxy-2-butanone-4-phosphate synthase [Candidatus Nesterenkonia stercoripullorum]
MFTGIVTGQGTVTARTPDPDRGVEQFTFSAPQHLAGLRLGASIAVDGVCVSAVETDGEHITVELIAETLRRTTLGLRQPGDRVNLERCLPAGERLDGHVVQGHVDGTAELIDRDPADGRHRFRVPAQLAEYLAEKGSVAVDGVSLTISAVSEPQQEQAWFEVGLIPTTLTETTLGLRHLGDTVNIEVDVLAKYAHRMLQRQSVAQPRSPEAAAQKAAEAMRGLRVPASQTAFDRAVVLDPVGVAVQQLRRGKPVVVVDDADRENEGDLIFAAAHATPELMGFTIRHSSGVVCVPMSGERARYLRLPAMVDANEDPKGTAYTISCDAAPERFAGFTTGVSAADRSTTARILADPAAEPADLSRPGHMFPLVAQAGGVRERAGHTEAAVDLCRLASVPPVGVIAELAHDDGSMMRLPALRDFADQHGLALIAIDDLQAYLDQGPSAAPGHTPGDTPGHAPAHGAAPADSAAPAGAGAHTPSSREQTADDGQRALPVAGVVPGPVVRLPTDYGVFSAQVWVEEATGHEHMLIEAAAPAGDPAKGANGAGTGGPLIRIHSECVTGDVFGSRRCDCGTQLVAALEIIQRDGGRLLYLR